MLGARGGGEVSNREKHTSHEKENKHADTLTHDSEEEHPEKDIAQAYTYPHVRLQKHCNTQLKLSRHHAETSVLVCSHVPITVAHVCSPLHNNTDIVLHSPSVGNTGCAGWGWCTLMLNTSGGHLVGGNYYRCSVCCFTPSTTPPHVYIVIYTFEFGNGITELPSF